MNFHVIATNFHLMRLSGSWGHWLSQRGLVPAKLQT